MNGNDLRIRVKNLGFELKEIADKLNITPQALNSKLLADDLKVSFVQQIAKAINKSVYYLIEDPEEKNIENQNHLEQPNWIKEQENKHDSPRHSEESLQRVGLRLDEVSRLLRIDLKDIAQTIDWDYTEFMVIVGGKEPAPEALLNAIANRFPAIDKTWLYTGLGSPISGDIPIPLIPVDAMAGFGQGGVQIMPYEAERYVIPEFSDLKVEFLIRVKGTSMSPTYNAGDLLGCKRIAIDTFFQWNKTYVIDTVQGPLTKRVHPSDKPNHIVCVSDNENYKPFELCLKNDVNALALVVGVIRFE